MNECGVSMVTMLHLFSRKGCTMPEIWDVEDPKNAGKEPLCLSINRKSEPYFKKVYHNEKFDVFKILM